MTGKYENPNPEVFEAKDCISDNERKKREVQEKDPLKLDQVDTLEIFDLIRHIDDPEHPLTLEQLNVVTLESIHMNSSGNSTQVTVHFTPTIPHCSMAQIIGLMIKVKLLRSLPQTSKIDVFITPGTHSQEEAVNKQINDKERVMAALENPSILRVVNKGVAHSDKLETCC